MVIILFICLRGQNEYHNNLSSGLISGPLAWCRTSSARFCRAVGPTLPKLAELEGQSQPRMEPVKEVGGTNDGEESENIRILINDSRGTKMFVLVIKSCSTCQVKLGDGWLYRIILYFDSKCI